MKRWQIIYDVYCDAVKKIYSAVSQYVDYTLPCSEKSAGDFNTVYIKVCRDITGYKIEAQNDSILIEGQDEINLLYAASDFKNKFIPYWKNPSHKASGYYVPFNSELPDYSLCTSPKIKYRGIWTWGHVIYDYRGFIDNMVTLRLNTLIIWNDFVPININEVIDYAHKNGVLIYLGFAWGWGRKCAETIKNAKDMPLEIAKKYQKEYAHINCDGIYFQTFTELETDSVDGIDVAESAVELVNKTAALIFEKEPDLKLFFGLHATSVKNKLDIIAKTDKRITVMWEDLGSFPYGYVPSNIKDFDGTLKLQTEIKERFSDFAAVLKGVACLDWAAFEHQTAPFIMGECSDAQIEKKVSEKKDLLRYIQAYWIKNAKYAGQIINGFSQNDVITVLCEDCAFERVINFPMAVYANMLWDSDRPTEDILCESALMSEVDLI